MPESRRPPLHGSQSRRSRRLVNRRNLLVAALGAGALAVVVFPSDAAGPAPHSVPAAAVTEPAAQSAKDVRGASPYLELEDEGPPELFVDPPLPEGLAQGIVWIQWRVENLHVVPVFGKDALSVSPRVGHLHVSVDDLPWWWADPGDINTIDIAGLPAGPHTVRIDLVNPNHEAFPGQSKPWPFPTPPQ